MKQFRGGLVSKAHRLLYHSTLGSRVTKKEKKNGTARLVGVLAQGLGFRVWDSGYRDRIWSSVFRA